MLQAYLGRYISHYDCSRCEMFIRYWIKLSLFLFVLLTGCGGSQESEQMLGAKSFKTYRFDECIAKVEIDKQRTLLHEEYKALSRFIVLKLVQRHLRVARIHYIK